jgi:type III restriction enzyme
MSPKTHIVLPFDAVSIEEIAANLDLRLPNVAALTALANCLDRANGQPVEVVLDLATAVGKTYIAAGLIDYVVELGVRNIVVITPSRAILTKTVNNFTRGHPKSIKGRRTSPLVITGDDFQRGEVGTALGDDSIVKLFVFTVQQLIRPKEKASRRVRDFQEGLGQGLYDFLRSVGDLVVIADEHHAYYGPAFSNAVRELDAAAIVGLTATPNSRTKPDEIIFHYTLGQAIADGLVKVPMLVGRKDDRRDTETQLADGLVLLNAKREAVESWCEHTGAVPVNPVMFIVCQTIDDANEVAEILGRPLFFGTDYADAVLTIHSDSSDEALEKLELVEEPSSKVRAIVSVSMLKEGWDVKNIYVICALRALASQVLTEQTLGRGLRLPFGQLTGVEMLDTVEVLGHDSYEALLKSASVLIARLVSERTGPIDVDPLTGVAPVPVETLGAPTPGGSERPNGAPGSGVSGGTLRVADTLGRIAQVQAEALAMKSVIMLRADGDSFFIPEMTRMLRPGEFSLSQIAEADFRAVGAGLAATPDDVLRRSKIEIVTTANGGLEVRPVAATDKVIAASPHLDLGEGRATLVEAMMNLGLVKATAQEKNGAIRLVNALIEGLGNDAEKRLSAFFNTVLDTVNSTLLARYRSVPAGESIQVSEKVLSVSRTNSRPVTGNHYEEFDRAHAYDGWKKSLVAIEWFDSSTERAMAILLDEDDAIKRWIRLHRSDGLVINYKTRSYYPDFAVEDSGGVYWLIETKDDRNLTAAEVLAKKNAAEEWARYATDSEQVSHKWRYLLVGETQLANAHGNWSVLMAQARA